LPKRHDEFCAEEGAGVGRETVNCPTCFGRGWVEFQGPSVHDPFYQDECPECYGRTIVPAEDEVYCAEEGYAGEVPREKEPDPLTVTDECVRVLREREIIGVATYNRPLMSSYKDFLEWLDDAIEEQADGLQYLVAARGAYIDFLRRNGINP
jgi:hypothetical protein